MSERRSQLCRPLTPRRFGTPFLIDFCCTPTCSRNIHIFNVRIHASMQGSEGEETTAEQGAVASWKTRQKSPVHVLVNFTLMMVCTFWSGASSPHTRQVVRTGTVSLRLVRTSYHAPLKCKGAQRVNGLHLECCRANCHTENV